MCSSLVFFASEFFAYPSCRRVSFVPPFGIVWKSSAGLRWGKSATMVILSLAVSTSSKLGLLISMSRNRLGLALALGVFLRMEYNRNRRFNVVGKEVPLVGVGIVELTVIRIALLVPSTADSRPWFQAYVHHPTSSWNCVREGSSVEEYNAQFSRQP